MNSEAFNIRGNKGIYAIPTNKRFIYGTDFVTILPVEANSDGNIQEGTMELNFPLRDLNACYSFNEDTGFKFRMGVQKKTNNAWGPVNEDDAKHVMLRPDFANYLFSNCTLMSYDRPVLPPCEGYQLSNELMMAALKAYLHDEFVSDEHPLPNDLVCFNSWDKTTYNLTGGVGNDKYQTAFGKLIKDTRLYRLSKQNDFVYRASVFPWFQYSFSGGNNTAIYSLESKDSADRRLHLRLVLGDPEKRHCFAYLADATGSQQYRISITKIELIVKRGLLVDAYIKSIPKQIPYNLLRWKVLHRELNSEYDTATLHGYNLYMPASVMIFLVPKYALSVEGGLKSTATAKTADRFSDLKMQRVKLYFDEYLVADGEGDSPLNFKKEEQMLHIYRSFLANAVVPDRKRKMSSVDFYDADKNRFLVSYLPLSSYGHRENAAPYTLPKVSFSPARFSKKADLRLELDFDSAVFSGMEVVAYLFYHIEAMMNTSKVWIENPMV